jgi:hypothetical protein
MTEMLVGAKESQQISATGGTGPYAFSWSGSLPPGLSLSSTGLISGSPTTAGSYQFTITATDSSAAPDSGSQTYTVSVQYPSPGLSPRCTARRSESARGCEGSLTRIAALRPV